MDRRAFLAALGIGVPLVAAPRRVYSFLWDKPLVEPYPPEVTMELVTVEGVRKELGFYWERTESGMLRILSPRLDAGTLLTSITINQPRRHP